eukprot:6468269-Amphidinium_carterae.1
MEARAVEDCNGSVGMRSLCVWVEARTIAQEHVPATQTPQQKNKLGSPKRNPVHLSHKKRWGKVSPI